MEQSRHLFQLGVDVNVLAPHHYNALHYEEIDGVAVNRCQYVWPAKLQTLCYGSGIPTNLKNSLWAKIQLPLLVFSLLINTLRLGKDADVLHAHWSIAGLATALAGKILRKPVVLMMHGAEIYVLKSNSILKWIIERADHVLCNSTYTLSNVLAISSPRSCSVISPGVDTDRFSPKASAKGFYQKHPDIPTDRPLIFALGKFIERKGFQHLIDAIALLSHENHDLCPCLMLGGRGPLKNNLRQRAQKRGGSHKVFFLNYIPDDTIPAYYTVADIFVLPSVVDPRGDTEGLGVVLLEALACETPCIASNVGGIVDVIQNGFNGFLVRPGDSGEIADRIRQLIEDDDLRKEMGKRGREYVVKNFSWKSKAKTMLSLYSKIVRRS
jgi:glycosyltransferase involved in cell wall biosynthesis